MNGLSICITTRDNLEYLKLCLEGLKKHSSLENEILIHVDGATDETAKWLEDAGYEFTRSEWKGTYSGCNSSAKRATKPYMIIYSDDMFCAPKWDLNLVKWLGENRVIVPRLVEPLPGSYPPPFDCGKTPRTFDEEKFVSYAKGLEEARMEKHSFGAFTLPTERYRSIGGYDTDFDPRGAGSIDLITTLNAKFPGTEFYEAKDVILYHFMMAGASKIPGRLEHEAKSVKHFSEKWGFNIDTAYKRLDKVT